MNFRGEIKPLIWILGGFLIAYYLPVGTQRFDNAVFEAFHLVKWYAREHVLLCLVPAFYIAGAIGVFVSQASVMKYLGAKANKVLAFGVASVSGTVLAVCSCTVLPLFAGIYRMGAGLGPATAFLYAGPAINVLAIVMTARVLGVEMGIARAVGAIGFGVIIGLLMQFIFRHDEAKKLAARIEMAAPENVRPLIHTILYFLSMIGILVFANWGKTDQASGVWHFIYSAKWYIAAFFSLGFATALITIIKVNPWKVILTTIIVGITALLFGKSSPLIPFTVGSLLLSIITATDKNEGGDWFSSTWGFMKQITPLLIFGVAAAGFFLGRVGNEGIISSKWIALLVGGNSLGANFFASVVGAFMYLATLTEVPIIQGLMGSGMGKGPALALLLAGPALSFQSMLVLSTIMGWKKTAVYISLVVVMATLTGLIYGNYF
jgi:uncharacterized membrane protein YraQ (UPF0718 family)